MIYFFALIILVVFIYESKFELKNHLLALYLPWLFILFFSLLDISSLWKELEMYTYIVIFVFILSYYLGFKVAKMYTPKPIRNIYELKVKQKNVYILYSIYFLLTILNIALAGYIPLISLFTTGNSGYMDFGISGLYGFYNAYSNALGVLVFYLYLVTRKKKYLLMTIAILVFFIFAMTRQNVISLLIEIFIVYSFIKKDISLIKILMYLGVLLLFFDIAGNARTADIFLIAEIKEEYYWLPSIVIWMYTYFYTNIVNLNNSINNTGAPYYDGSSISELVPNVIKRYFDISFEHEYFLEKINFTVSSAINELYIDFGIYEVGLFSFIFSLLASLYLRKIQYNDAKSFLYISIYSVFFFCATFSFFVNFWFYLPIVFQIPMLYIINKFVLKRKYTLNA